MKQSMRALRAVTAMLLAAALTGSLSACRREETPVSAPESGAASGQETSGSGDSTTGSAPATEIVTDASGGTMVVTVPGGGDKTNPSGGTKATSGSTAVSAPPALTLYAAPASLPAGLKNTDYTFQVKGGGKDWQKVAAYNVKVDPELPANTRVVDGKGNTIEPKVQNSPLISFDLSGRAEVSITKNRGTFNASAVKVYPESLGIKPTVSGNKLTFAMNGAQKLAVSLDGTKTNMAYIMANDPVSKPKAQKTFPAGVTTLPEVGFGVWNGTIRNVYLYKMALPEALITQLKDTDTVPMDGKPVLLKKYAETMTFDGLDDYKDMDYLYNASGQFSISAKVTLKAGSDATPMQRGILMEGLYRRSDGTLASNIGGWETPYVTKEKLPADGKEHHVALVKDGQKITVYIDGKACTAQNGSDKRPSDTQSVQIWTVIGAGQIVNGYYPKSGETVYLEPGAVVRGSLLVCGVKNVKIAGRGMVDIGTVTNDVIAGGFNFNTQRGVIIAGSDGVTVDGITFSNAYSFSVSLQESKIVTLHNLKIFSHYGATDGVNIKASSGVTITDSFIRSNDDCISVYASSSGAIGNSSGVTAKGCTLLSDSAHAVFTGIHADPGRNETISDLTFQNIDVIDSRTPGDPYYGVLGVNAGDNVTVKNVVFDGVRISGVSNQQLFNVRVMMNAAYNSQPGKAVENVVFKNIAYTGAAPLKSGLSGYDGGRQVKGVTFENVVIGGAKLTAGNASSYLAVGSQVTGLQYK